MIKKKDPSLNFIIPMGTYPFDLMVSINQTDDQLGRVLDGYSLTEDDIRSCQYASSMARGRYCLFSTGGSFIRLRHIPHSSEDFETLAHEVFHVVATLMDHIGI